jgi:SAM-dependent methyltransferase
MNGIINNRTTDKNTTHSYIEVYERLFAPIRESSTRILEVGIALGGSIELWSKYFSNAEVIGVDPEPQLCYDFSSNNRITLFKQNAYDVNFVERLGVGTFDIVIDDGPHTHQSMIDFASMYPKLLKPNGIFVIEDVQSSDWIPSILTRLPANMQQNVIIYDRRHIKGRYDDIMIIARNEF